MTSFHIRVLLRSLTHHTLGYDVTSGVTASLFVCDSEERNDHDQVGESSCL